MNGLTEATRAPRQHQKSSTRDILGGSEDKPITGKWASQHRRLTELRAQFVQERRAQSASAQEEISNFSEHMADAASDSYDRDCALALLSSTQEALYEIDEALQRIASGTYGFCQLSGKPIEIERLRVIPWARFSKAAQMQLEASGAGNRAQLGELRSCSAPAGTEESSDEAEEELGAAKKE